MSQWRRCAIALALFTSCSSGSGPRRPISTPPGEPRLQPAPSIYFVLVDRFANGDPDNDTDVDMGDPQGWHGGDLRGVLARVPYIAGLGFSQIWLSPVFETRSEKFHGHGAFHGYWTTDIGHVDSRFGTRAELFALGRALEARGMSMLLDLVVNHVGYEAPLTRKRPTWFHGLGSIENWNDPHELENRDVHGLPDLAQENPEVFAYLVDRTKQWLQTPGLAGFRLDAVKHVSSSFWRPFMASLRTKRPLTFLGEDFTGVPRELVARLDGDGFDQVFDFPLYYAMIDTFCKGATPQTLGAALSVDVAYPSVDRLVTFADNHDLPRLHSLCTDERARDLLAFQLTARGVPAVTYGTEVGLRGAKEPDNRADMRFASDTAQQQLIRRLLRARARIPALTRGRDVHLLSDEQTFAYARIAESQAIVVTVHTGDEPRPIPLPPAFANARLQRELTRDRPVGALEAEHGTRVFVFDGDFAQLSQPEQVTVRFRAPEALSGEMRIVGSHPVTGMWKPDAAPRFFANELTLEVPRGATLAYKLVRTRPELAWEGGGNRYLFVNEDTEVPIQWRE